MKKLILPSLLASALLLPTAAKADFINVFDISYTGEVTSIHEQGFFNGSFNGAGVFSFDTPLADLTAGTDTFTDSPAVNFDFEASFWYGDNTNDTFFSFKLSDWLNGTDCSGAATCPSSNVSFIDFTLLSADPTGLGQSDAYFNSTAAPSSGDNAHSFGIQFDDAQFGSFSIFHSTSETRANALNDDFSLMMTFPQPIIQDGPSLVIAETASYSMTLRDPGTGTPTDPTDPTTPTDPTEVPEPSAWALMLAGMALIIGRRRFK